MPQTAPEVLIVGAGLAGTTAALRLAERGYRVTVYEQDSFVGGQFRAVPLRGGKTRHEHCYHLYEAWYHNFWDLVAELGLQDRFEGRNSVRYLARGQFPKMTELRDVGSWSNVIHNLLSGVLPIPDMYLFLYSYVDLLASPLQRDRYRDVISVNEFMHSRPYATERSTAMHDNVLFKAFGCPIFDSSVQSYQKFVSFGAATPSPMCYVMKDNVYDSFWFYLEKRLADLQVTIHKNKQLLRIDLDAHGEVSRLHFAHSEESPTLVDSSEKRDSDEIVAVNGSVILAVPPTSVSNLISSELYKREPRWGLVDKLRSEPMASVHLHFNQKFVDRLMRFGVRRLPKDPVILIDSRFSITFLDNSHTWSDVRFPYLHVIASDYKELSRLDRKTPFQYTYQGRLRQPMRLDTDPKPEIAEPKTPLDYILAELSEYLPFSVDELDLDSLEIHTNMRYPIFINEIGSWPNRPTTRTAFRNLFMAGAHCQNVIDVTTVEGAVLSGLEAAAAVQRRHRVGTAVKIIYPHSRPFYHYIPLQLMGAPYAMMAKILSELNALREPPSGNGMSLVPRTKARDKATLADAIIAPYARVYEVVSEVLGLFRVP
jgi:zeta-carotene desaturase